MEIIQNVVLLNLVINKIWKFKKLNILHIFCYMLELNKEILHLSTPKNQNFGYYEIKN
jgi:hypothetical protein